MKKPVRHLTDKDFGVMVDRGIKAVDLYAIARDDIITKSHLKAFLKAALAAATLVTLTAQTIAPPQIPDEATKVRALILGYVLNGNSMVREPGKGSIDVSEFISGSRLSDQPPVTARGPK